jgi:hypothetical protein
MLANYSKKDMSFKIKWIIDEDASEEYEFEFLNDEKDEENNWFTIDIREKGCKPIKVSEGQKIHVCAKVMKEEHRPVYYGTNRGYDDYKDIEG